MNECPIILAVSTNIIHVCILASILPYNLAKYHSFSWIGPYICLWELTWNTSLEQRENMAAVPGSSIENETRFDRAKPH